MPAGAGISTSLLYNWRLAWRAALSARAMAVRPAEFIQFGVVADVSAESPTMPMAAEAVCPRDAGRALAARAGVEIDLPNEVRVRVDSGTRRGSLNSLSCLPGADGFQKADFPSLRQP